ncbi:hypothetical protein QS257_06375 [Terrilactibacillus sp. S3-3]|nr:hypothetical protein QS257_06375 [Terrilactibacillus sp. S3-3]
MITATLTSLVVIPTIYHWLFAMKIRKGRLNAADGREALKEG